MWRAAAVDLGATSGRVMVGTVAPGLLELAEVHRFDNGPVTSADGSLHWDVRRLYDEVLAGLRAAGRVDAIGVDAWAIDYGLLDASGELLGDPFCYRDPRTQAVQERVVEAVSLEELYAVTGVQHLPFNTIYQLAAEADLSSAAILLLLPDLLTYWLTGVVGAEATNASTTQLYDVRSRTWAIDLVERLALPARLLPPLREAGEVIGTLSHDPSTKVVAVGSHDTASAVVAVPFADARRAAYISSGTWSLVGVETDAPVLTDAAREANFTNEGGVEGTIRFLRNVMGLWVLGELMREWEVDDVEAVLRDAERAPSGPVVDIDDSVFLAPGPMQRRLEDACVASGQQPPGTRGGLARCVLESLAQAYRDTVLLASELSGQPVDVVHVVGGGARNELLCRLTADACGVPVLAGPVEATALGNVLVQARTLGADLPDLAAMRALVRRTHDLVRYEPADSVAAARMAE